MVFKKHEIEVALYQENQEIKQGKLKEDNPLDLSEDFRILCQSCRRGDLKVCQEKIQEGVNINARDPFDYTPLILASLCGHYEVVELLLESGALCERDTFQGERCLYNALNDRIRNLLLSYDYSKSRDPLQPFAGHITSLLSRDVPKTSDITITTDSKNFHLHKLVLSARSPYFAKKLNSAPETTSWRIPNSIPARSLEIAIYALYLAEINSDLGSSEEDQAVLIGIEKLARQLEIGDIFDTFLESNRRLARQKRTEEVSRGRDQLEEWFQKHILANAVNIDTDRADDVKWDSQNRLFADVLLCADEEAEGEENREVNGTSTPPVRNTDGALSGIPVGPSSFQQSRSPSRARRRSVLFPAHRAILIRAEYFSAMFSSPFKEAQPSEHLPIVHVDCSPTVLEIILAYLYTERATVPLEFAIDVLFAADQLFIEKLKVQAATIISTLGSGGASVVEATNSRGAAEVEELIDVYDVIRAGWLTRVHRLEEFGARYIAYRLERYVDEDEFKELVKESAARIQRREETDSIELIDDIRYYLSERFRLRFEDAGIDEMLEDEQAQAQEGSGEEAPEDILLSAREAEQGVVRTLDGEIAGDEFAQDALNYQILLGKIDSLLENLKLDA